MTAPEHLDVLIVGAGLSGIGAAYHLQQRCPAKRYAIVEARDAIGGTWDLFRYPGVRSDSDMHTLGYSFRPWTGDRAIADGASILKYVRATAREHAIDRHIRFGTRVVAADWSSAQVCWSVTLDRGGGREVVTTSFLYLCSGYYSYDQGHRPGWPGEDDFGGQIAHPQFWHDDIDYAGKRVVVIGSGATAVTLVPELARTAAHVTMLQRSPTYVVSRPVEDRVANALRRVLPAKLAYGVTRWKNVLLSMFLYKLARGRPEQTKQRLVAMIEKSLGPDYDIATHFTPSYKPWDQRLCLVPDDDLFDAIKSKQASVVTGRIERFTKTGITLTSGEAIAADLVVTATGLNIRLHGDIAVTHDGETVDLTQAMIYKGMMASGIPNFAFTFGYTNASWTLKADLTSAFVCRLLKRMERRGVRVVTPAAPDANVTEQAFVDFTSGYVERARDTLPRQGSKHPWKLHQNYVRDLMTLRFGRIDDGTLIFSAPAREQAAP